MTLLSAVREVLEKNIAKVNATGTLRPQRLSGTPLTGLN